MIFEILPGEGIGPFKLGMTRAQVQTIAQSTSRTDANAGADADAIGDTGLTIHYNESGRCSRVSALFGMPPHRYRFTLFGHDICGAVDSYVIELCEDRWPDVHRRYGGIDVPSAGFSAIYWDSKSDGCFSAVDVVPPRRSLDAS
jgi:hypothetical protein